MARGAAVAASTSLGAAVAEAIGTFILVFVGTAVAAGAIIGKATGGSA